MISLFSGENARTASVQIEIAGTDVSQDLAPYLISFKHSDSIDKKSDTISFSLYNADLRFLKDWVITKGTEIKATIITRDWLTPGSEDKLDCGRFQVDSIDFEIEAKGGAKLEVKATSIPVTGSVKGTKKFRAWEGADMKTITEKVAKDSDLEVQWEIEENPRLARTDQDGESDLEFINRMAEEDGHCCKVTDKKVVVFDEEAYEKRPPFLTITLGSPHYETLKLKTTAQGKFKECCQSYTSSKTGKTVEEIFNPSEPPEGAGGTLNHYRRFNAEADDDEYEDLDDFESEGMHLRAHLPTPREPEWELPVGPTGRVKERGGRRTKKAKARASKELRKANKDEWTVDLKGIGNVLWNAGQTFLLSAEFGPKFGRKYLVKEVTHEVSKAGYTCDVKAHGVLSGY